MLICLKQPTLAFWGERLLDRDMQTLNAQGEAELHMQRRRAIAERMNVTERRLSLYPAPQRQTKLSEAVQWWEVEVADCAQYGLAWTNTFWYEKRCLDWIAYCHDAPGHTREILAHRLMCVPPDEWTDALIRRIEVADQCYRSMTRPSDLSFADLIDFEVLDPETEWYHFWQPLDYPAELGALNCAQWKFAKRSLGDFLSDRSCFQAINPDYMRLLSPRFVAGMDVLHQQLGRGCVNQVDADQDSMQVDFDAHGLRKLRLSRMTETPLMFPSDWI